MDTGSGELLSGGESLCRGTSLTSEPLPPGLASSSGVGLAGLEHVADPLLLPTAEEEEEEKEEGERVGLCWFPCKSWNGTVARRGCSGRCAALPLPAEGVGGAASPPALPRGGPAEEEADADIVINHRLTHFYS